MDVTVTVTVYPEEGEFPRIAKALLDVADDPSQVLTVSNPRMGFRVPEEVFERFHAAQAQAWEAEDETPAPEPVKRRGRPRKNSLPEPQETDSSEVVVSSPEGGDGQDTEGEEK